MPIESRDMLETPVPGGTVQDSSRMLTTALVATCLVVATMTSLGAPLIPSIAEATKVSLSSAQWILTAALLTGGLATPIMGRLADGPHQRRVVVVTLVVILVGSLLAVVSDSFPLLVVARALQGCGFGAVPVTMAIARRHQPTAQATRTVATLSVTTAVGVGLGFPMSGLLDTAYGYRSAFWLGAGVSVVALGLALRYLPRHDDGARAVALDARSAILMCLGLSGVILVLSEGVRWGWTSVLVLTMGPVSLLIMAAWIRRELVVADPLVALRQLTNRSVLTADLSTILVSAAMYLYLPIVVDVVQAPHVHGVGLGESVLVSGLVLMPMSACTLLASMASVRVGRYAGPRAILPLGSLAFAATMILFAFVHDALWQAFVSMALLGVGCGLTFAAMPRMIVNAVAADETGRAMGLYQVLRSIGMATGSALCGVLIAAHTEAGDTLPSLAGYQTCLLAGAALSVLTAVFSYLLPAPSADGTAPTALADTAEFGGLP